MSHVATAGRFSADRLALHVDAGEAKRLASAIQERRAGRNWTQAEVAAKGSLSLDRVQAFESGRAGSYRDTTVTSMERGLEWAPGSVRRLLIGEPAQPIESLEPDEFMVSVLRAIAGNGWQRLWVAFDRRRRRLRLSWRQVVWRADLERSVLLELGDNRRAARVREMLECALELRTGSIEKLLNEEEPVLAPGRQLLPSEHDQVERMDPPSLPAPGRALAKWAMGTGGGPAIVPEGTSLQHEARIMLHLQPQEAKLIRDADLPLAMQEHLVAYVIQRRAAMDAEMISSLQVVINALRTAAASMQGPISQPSDQGRAS